MTRELVAQLDGYGGGSGGFLFVLCAVVFSLTVISMVVFACGDGDCLGGGGGGGGHAAASNAAAAAGGGGGGGGGGC